MFRSSTIIRVLALNLAKVIFTLKHSVKLRLYLLCGCMAACQGMAIAVVWQHVKEWRVCCMLCICACNTQAIP